MAVSLVIAALGSMVMFKVSGAIDKMESNASASLNTVFSIDGVIIVVIALIVGLVMVGYMCSMRGF